MSKAADRPTPTVEDYLMAMYIMERHYGEIVAARLAEMLNVSPATVTVTLKRMERDNWIAGKGRKGIRLTEEGRGAAHSVIRRHMLTEWMLVKLLNVPIAETHHQAHDIEHAISPELEERLREVLEDPKVCPHGNPFPGFEEFTSEWAPLTDLTAGDAVVIRRIHQLAEGDRELLQFLADSGIAPGAKVEVLEVLPFNQTVSIRLNGKTIVLGSSAARFIYTESESSAG